MSLLRWFGDHHVLTILVAGLVLVGAAGCGSADADRPSTRPGASAHDPQQGASQGHRRGDDRERAQPTAKAVGAATGRRTPDRRRPEPERSAPPTYLVTRVVDGDTLELGNGETVRMVGIDTPEVGECGFEQASANLSSLTLGKQVRLTRSDEDRDRYGRLLRYVDAGEVDAGLRLIRNGLAIARYDSRDGYGYHPREPAYVAADRNGRSVGCAPSRPLVSHADSGGCAPGYAPCVPAYPPDVDCADVSGPVHVTGTDPHALDGDGDGTACE